MAVTNNFSASTLDLNGQVGLSQPTALVWGPDGRLYITEVDGDVKVLTVAFGDKNPADADATAQFYVTDSVTVDLIKGAIQNHNDDGTENGGANRQVTGIDVTAQYDASGAPMTLPDGTPMVTMYVTSSDSRIGAGGSGNDSNLDTNSGVITMMTQTGPDTWTAIDIVRGLPRSEENHATNGLEVIQEFDAVTGALTSERMIVANGGNANSGAPSNNFAGQEEQPLSAAILEIDLTMLKGMPILNDGGRAYIYDLPTLNDPIRPDDVDGTEANDPFGGNDSKNSAKLLADGPVSIYSPGYRNAYDVEVTEDGRVWTYDNGANNSWGGRPIGEAGDNGNNIDIAQALGYIATNLNNGEGNSNDDINLVNWDPSNKDNFHEITRSDDLAGRTLSAGQGGAQTFEHDGQTYVYGGHPNPIRAEGSRAGLLFSPDAGTDNAYLLVSNQDSFGNGGGSDYAEVIAWLTEVENNNAAFPSSGIFGANTGDLTKKVLAVTPGVLYDIYSFTNGTGAAVVAGASPNLNPPVGGTFQGQSGLPADIADVVAYKNPIEGDYKEAGKTDGALDTGNGSINGLAEYTSTILDEGGTKMSGAILATVLGGGNIIVMGRNADGSMSSVVNGGFATAADRTTLGAGGGPLGITTVGDDYIDRGLTQPFQGSIWTAVYQQNGPLIEIFQPDNGAVPLAGSEIVNPTDRDLDGVDHFADPFEFSDDNGYAIAPGETIVLDFNPSNTNFPTSLSSTGLLGAALDGTTPNRDAQTVFENFTGDQVLDGLYDIGGNVLPGGNAPILQIKKVIEGSVVGAANSARDVLHTGIRPSEDTDRIVATMNVKNWIPTAGGVAPGQLTGMIFGDGTQANFLRVVFGSVNGVPGIEVGYEIGDANYTTLAQVAVPGLSDVSIETVDLRLTIDMQNGFAVGAEYRLQGQADFTALALGGFFLPAGVLRDVLTGDHTIGTGAAQQASGAAIGFLAETSAGNDLEAIDFNNLEIEAFGNEILADTAAEVGLPGSVNTDTVIYTGTDTALAALAPNVENFDGTGSAADFVLTANDLDNLIRVGSGTNTVTTGAGADSVRGTLADLDGDEITDFSTDDAVLIEGATLTNLGTPVFSGGAGSATITLGGATITLSGSDLDDYDPADAGASINITQGADGVRITLEPALSPVIAISAGGADLLGATVRDQSVDFLSDAAGGAAAQYLTGVTSKSYTNATIGGTDIPGTDLDAIHQTERSAVDAGKWGYGIPVENGNYLVDLYFAEIYHGVATGNSSAGLRLFDIFVEDDTVETGLDVLTEAGGPAQELVKTYQATVTDGVLNIDFDASVDQAKLSGLVVWKVGGTFVPPADSIAPEIVSIEVPNPSSVQDGERQVIVTLTDETGFDAADFAGLTGGDLSFTGIVPDAVSAPVVVLSDGDKTATLTYTLSRADNSWPNGAGEVTIAAGAYDDAAGNPTQAASAGFVLEPNLDNLERGVVVRAINIGTDSQAPGTLGPDPLDGGVVDNNRYGGALTDTIIKDAFGNFVTFEADSDAYHTSPKPNQFANVDGQSGGTGSNAGGIDLDGSAYHTYRDSAAGSWTSTFSGFANGSYIVELHFAELFAATQATARVGDFTVNGVVFGDDYNAFASAQGGPGADKPSFIRKAVTVTDGTIQVLVDDASVGQPAYSAIVVYDAVNPSSPPALSVGDVTVVEGDLAEITILRSGNLAEATTVDVALSFDGTADAGDVGTLSASSVTFAAGEASKTLTLTIIDDETEEGAETLTVTLSNPTGAATLADASATVTIAASDSDVQAPVGGTILELDFETAGDPLAEGGFDGLLGGAGAADGTVTTPPVIVDGELQLTTSNGDLSQTGQTDSKNDFVKAVNVSDPALTEIYLTTRFDNPFSAGTPNYVQQGIVIAVGDEATQQDAGNFLKLIVGGNGGDAAQLWTQGNGVNETPQVSAMSAAASASFTFDDVATVELSMRFDKTAGTTGMFVTFFDASGAVLGGVRPEATSGFLTVAPAATPAPIVAAINDGTSVFGVTSTDFDTPAPFLATWDFLRLSSPQFTEAGGDALVSVAGADVVENGDAGTTDLTFTLSADDGHTGILSVTLSIDAGAGPVESTQDVTFTAGIGSVTAPVANDTRWNGAESVTVEIVSVETDGYARNPSAATATAGVTEDDLADSFGGAVIGDFSDDRLDPTDVPTLTLGETVLVATQQGDSQPGGRDRDYITFEVPEGQELTGLFLDGYVTTEITGQAFMGLQEGAAITVDPLTGQPDAGAAGLDAGIVYSGGDIAGNLLEVLALNDQANAQGQTFAGIPEKLPAGAYTLWLNQGGEPTTVTLRLVTEAATGSDVTLSIADAPTLVEAGDSGTTDLAFALTATGDFTGGMDIEFTQGGTPSSATVTFTDGAGVLTIPVANDDADTGDTTVSITLTGATSAADAIAIGTDAASATGTVTEDDNMPIFERGDVVAAFNAGGPALTFDGIDFAAALSGTDGAPFAGGAQFTDNDGGNGVQDVYTGTIYQTEINDGGNDATPGSFTFSTSAGIDPTKSYFVDLYLAEIYTDVASTGPGTGRVFSVFAEDGAEPVLADFDVVAETGNADIPVVVQLAAPISPGANGAIDLSFIAAVDRAKVSAIVIREAVLVDPTAVAVSVVDVTVSEEAGFADIVFTREGNTDTDMTITFSTADGGATAGADYTAATAGTVTILAGETSATAQIALTGDDLEEGDETFTVTIDSAAADGATVTVTRPSATVTLTDDDAVDPLDIDGDGIANTDDPFAYDGTNGDARVLAAGGEFTQGFDTATTDPFDAAGGFSGILVNPAFDYGNPADPAADPYGNRTSGAPGVEIAGGTLNVTSTETDAFPTSGTGANNTLADGYQSAVDVTGVNSFEVHARASSADWFAKATTTTGYEQFGISLGAGGVDDFVKLVIADEQGNAQRVQLAHNNSLVGGENNYAVGAANGPSVDLALVGDVEFRLIVDKTAGTVIGQVDFFASADGALLTSFTTPPATILADSSLVAAMNGANPLTGGDGGLAYGIFVTDWGGSPTTANRITANYDFLTIRALDAVPAALVSIFGAPSVMETGDDGVTTLLFDLAYTGGADETRVVTYTVNGGDEQSESVTFTDGAATLAVDVTNDDLADGDDAVTVVLTGIGDNVADMVDPTGSSATGTVTEDDFAPVAVADAPSTAQNTPITFDPAANDTDLDGGPLVVTAIDTTGLAGGTVTLVDGVVTVTPDTDFIGDIAFGYTVTDPAGNSAPGTAAVTVTANTLISLSGAPVAVEAGDDGVTTLSFTVSTDASVDGDVAVTYAVGGAAPVAATISFAEGVGALEVPVANDDLANGDESVQVALVSTSTPGFAVDATAATGTVTEDDFAPVAVADAPSTAQNTPITFDPAANDTDLDGGPLVVTAIDTTGLAGGTVMLVDGVVTVTPDTDFIGDIAFGYTVTDPAGNSAPGTAAVTVEAPPVLGDPIRIEAEDFSSSVVYAPQSVGSASGDEVIFLPRNGAAGSATYDLATKGVAPGTYDIEVVYYDENDGVSTVDLTLNGTAIGSIAFDEDTPSNAASSLNIRSQTFFGVTVGAAGVLVLDGMSDAGEFARIDYIEFTPVEGGVDENTAPFAPFDLPDASRVQNADFDFDAGALFADAEEDALTFTATTVADDGVLVGGLPEGVTFDTATGIFGGAPSAPGSYEITVTASDGTLPSTPETFTLTVLESNDAPVLDAPIADQTVRAGDAVNFDVTGSFSDPDSDDLIYAVAGDLPPGVTFDAATGLFGGTVAASAPARSYEVTVTATDVTGSNTGVSDTFLFNVTGGGVDTRPTVRIEAEDGTLVDGFFTEKGERIRLLAEDDGTATYDLSEIAPGAYQIRIGYFDENDGESTLGVAVSSDAGTPFSGGFTLDEATTSAVASQSRNFREKTLDGTLTLGANGTLTLTGQADAGEFLRVDWIELIPVGGGGGTGNFAPSEAGAGIPDATVQGLDAVSIDTAAAFADPEEDALTYAKVSGPDWVAVDPATGEITGTPPAGGVYAITVSAEDAANNPGILATSDFTLTVEVPDNVAPTADAIILGAVDETAAPVSIDLLADANAADGDGDTLAVDPASVTVQDQGANPVSFTLDGATLSIDPAQFAALDAGESATVTVTYDIIDGKGGVTPNTATLSVDGVDDASAPTVSIAGTPTAPESGDDGTQTTLLFDLAYTGGANETRDVTYTVNGDARTATVTFLDGAGSLAVSVDNDDLANGTDNVTVVLTGIGDNVTDMVDIAARTATGTVSEDDFAPVAVADTANTAQGAPITFDPAANDTDADGGPLTVTAIDIATTTGGSVILNGDGTVTVTPDAGFAGQIAFGYTVEDSAGNLDAAGSAAVTVTGGVDTRPTVRIEAETGTLSGGFSVESGRIRTTSDGEATYDLSGVAGGDYLVRLGYWDENDGASSVGVTMSSASAGTFSDTLLLDEATPSSRFSAQNYREVTLDGAFKLGANGLLTLTGLAQGSEIVRVDYIELIPTGAPAGNAAPSVSLVNALAGIPDDADTGARIKVADIVITDDGQGVNALGLAGDDAGLFEIVGTGLFLKAGSALDATANPSLDVTVTVDDATIGGSPDGTALLSLPVTETGGAPSVSVGVGSSTAEGDPAVATLTLSETSDQPITVTLVLSSGLRSDPATIGAAAGGGDLAFDATGLATLDVTIPAGSLSVDVPFSIFQDTLDEADFETYEITITAANVGASIDGAAEQVAFAPTPAEGGILDDDEPVTTDDLAPDGDLDGDGTANSVDGDVDGDGTANADDPFAYDAENGMTLAAGETKVFDFGTDGTIFQNGLTGFLQATTNGGAFDEDTGANSVSGGLLTVNPVTAGDTGGTNNPQDDAVVGVKNGTFVAKAVVLNPWVGAATNPNSFDQLGLVLGLDSDDMIKLVFGQSAGVVEFQKQETTGTTTTATKYGGGGTNANVPLPAGVTLDTFAKAEITFEVVSTGPAAATVTGTIVFQDAGGTELGRLDLPAAPIGGALAAALADAGAGVAVGFTHVDGGGDPGFIAQLDSLTITEGDGSAPGVDTDAPMAAITLTNPVDATAPLLVSVALDDASGIDTGTLGDEDLQLVVNGFPAVATITYIDFAAGVARYSIAAPDGGWTDGLDVAVTLLAGEVADLASTPNTNAAVSQPLTLDIGGGTGGGEDEVVFRINAGGNFVAATDGGPDWVADSIATPNVYLTVSDNRNDTGGTAASTFDGIPSAVFAEARSSDAAFSYDIPTSVLENGENYEVRLYFAEIFSGAQGGDFRNFDATVEGFVPAAFNNIDPGALFGANAGVLTTQVKVTDGTLNIGFTQDVAQNPIISAIEIVKLSTDVENPEPPVNPGNALEAFAAQDDIVKDAAYGAGVTGSAVLEIMTGDNNIQSSNFGSNSFEVTNTGGKKISAIFIDVSSALYQDSVFDPDGLGGDNAAKSWQINSAGNTGAFITGTGYFLPGIDPIPNSGGSGGASNGGFKGAMVKFNAASNGGFELGETVGFSGDMDPNSIAGMTKASVDGTAILSWDVGGISGHELIGSLFTVLFDDGTTASGQLASDGSSAGSHALATQGAAPATAPGIAVNGVLPGQNGTYGGTLPTITVTGNPGDKVQITMTKGFNPVTETDNGIAGLVEDRLERYDFKANNAFDAQTKIVTIGADGTFDASTLFDYDDAINNNVGSGSFAGDDVAQIGFVATKVQDGGAQLPIGPTTAPIYLTNVGGPVTGDPTGGTGGDGYFEIIGSGNNARFKIQIEDENANGGTNPQGNWTYVDGDGADGKQSGTQGGHYFWGSEADSVGLNGPQANSFLNYDIFIPEGQEGVYNLRVRASRDTGEPSDQRNDVWVRIDDDAEALQVNPTDSVSSNGFVKVFGGGTNSWGFANSIDSVSEEESNFSATFELSAGLHTITLAGRSQGFHIDFFDLYKGGAPSTNASNSTFIEGEPGDGGGGTGGVNGELRKAIVSGSDDTDQNADAGTVNLTKADMELGDGGRDIGLRFTDLDLESLEGVDILDAYIEFTARSGSSGAVSATVKLEDSLNPATFSAASGPADRDTFDFTADWTDSSVPAAGSKFRTDDLSDLIEAFVASRNAELGTDDDLAFVIEDVSGVRKALSFEGGAAAELVLILPDDTILG